MNEENSLILEMYGNPTIIQDRLISGLEAGPGDGNVVTSPCNVVAHMIESFAVISSDMMADISTDLRKTFRSRAQTIGELSKHMSDYDGIGIYATPGSTVLEFSNIASNIFEKGEWAFNKEYKKCVIPRYTKFNIDGVNFSNFYPIEFRFSNTEGEDSAGKGITVAYDTETEHPLLPRPEAQIDYQRLLTGGLDMINVKLPVHQFEIDISYHSMYEGSGFSIAIPHTDTYYATRVFSNLEVLPAGANVVQDHNGVAWTELRQSLDSNIYDPSSSKIPLAVVQPDSLESRVSVKIPNVFINEKVLGTRLRVEIYTTKGRLSMDISDLLGTTISAEFPTEGEWGNKKYSAFLNRPESIAIYPLQAKILDGTDGILFENLRNKVIYNTNGKTVKVSIDELRNLYKDKGYAIEKFKDGITDRIYLACKAITATENMILPSGNIVAVVDTDRKLTPIDPANPNSELNECGISSFRDGSFTISPQAIFKYDKVIDKAFPVYGEEYDKLTNINISQNNALVTLHEANTYLSSPFYVVMRNDQNIAMAKTYNLDDPELSQIHLTKIVEAVTQIYHVDTEISHKVNLDHTGSFNIATELIISDDVSVDRLTATITIDGFDDGEPLVLDMEKNSADGLYKTSLETTHRIDAFDRLECSIEANGLRKYYMIPLEAKATMLLRRVSNVDISTEYAIKLTLGHALNGIHTTSNSLASNLEFEKYDADIPALRTRNEYRTYPDGGLDVSGGLDLLYEKGSVLFESRYNISIDTSNYMEYLGSIQVDGDGVPSTQLELTENNHVEWGITIDSQFPAVMVKKFAHRKGDTVTDDHTGQPTIAANRRSTFNTTMTLVTAKAKWILGYTSRQDYMLGIREILMAHASAVEESKGSLLQNTEIFFSPRRSIGLVPCRTESSFTTLHDLELDIVLRLHVVERVMSDLAEQANIRSAVLDILDNHMGDDVFSLVDIAKTDIIPALPNLITSVDVLGINGSSTEQTIVPIDPAVTFGLRYKLILNEDNLIEVDRALRIEFVHSTV